MMNVLATAIGSSIIINSSTFVSSLHSHIKEPLLFFTSLTITKKNQQQRAINIFKPPRNGGKTTTTTTTRKPHTPTTSTCGAGSPRTHRTYPHLPLAAVEVQQLYLTPLLFISIPPATPLDHHHFCSLFDEFSSPYHILKKTWIREPHPRVGLEERTSPASRMNNRPAVPLQFFTIHTLSLIHI
eukprot:TRINITY_DN17050_c0_g1_i3.p1 TRINITY_DN17050_c0_g1~~TRINITY_DN17050_c0_g1_i3.p1  ORF type:complete len:184 (+),score=24.69 TRINITY_DN17050_c0_g1_i3:577-1128(+)